MNASMAKAMPIHRSRFASIELSSPIRTVFFSSGVNVSDMRTRTVRRHVGSSSLPRVGICRTLRTTASPDANSDEEEHTAQVADDGSAFQRCQRELDRREGEGGRQRKNTVGTEVYGRPKRTNNLGVHARQEQGGQDAQWHGEQDQRVEDKRREKSPTKVVGLADGSGVNEGMHPRLHVPRRRTAGHGRGHQNPEQAGEDSVLGDVVWGIDERHLPPPAVLMSR